VASFSRHGAVLDLDGVEGFVHVSELAAGRVERAEDVVKLGEQVRARVLSVEDGPKGLRIRLSLKALSNTPAAAPGASPPPPVDEVMKGVVTRAGQRGVFVQTPVGEGLVPLRELGLPPGGDHRRAYPPGREMSVVVVSRAGGKLTLSATEVARVEERKNYREFSGGSPAAPSGGSFGSLGDVLRTKLGAASSAPSPKSGDAPPRRR
jgi:ribosomal protein S1